LDAGLIVLQVPSVLYSFFALFSVSRTYVGAAYGQHLPAHHAVLLYTMEMQAG